MAISPSVSSRIECARCDTRNHPSHRSCSSCGLSLSPNDDSVSSHATFSDGNGLSEEDRQALINYAEVAQLLPVPVASQSGVHPFSSPPQISVSKQPVGLKTMQVSGITAFAMGLFLCGGNLLGFLPTLPFLGYFSLLIGGALWHSSTHISD